ncbi:hypothetical protein ATANTOWER_015570 [Ataeniobius toweri]|uniref:Uncharacterized protein n=1 Tax=Ataeniobius toweri TaxID=208326 RepID=A0ABU7BPX4_9TELE|nr:hypothetical protein [Ataeniobius toweri]
MRGHKIISQTLPSVHVQVHRHTKHFKCPWPETENLKMSVSGGKAVVRISCMCKCVFPCVCRGNTGAVRDTEEETALLAFELDLEKKAVFASCQIRLTTHAFQLQTAKTVLNKKT